MKLWFMSMTEAMNDEELERRVAERTAQLVAANTATERALRRSETRFRALIENSLDVTVILTADAAVAYVSPSVERVLGYTPDEITGRTSFDFIHPDDTTALFEIFARATAAPGVMQMEEFRAQHKDGSWRQMEAVGLNLLGDPAVDGLVVTARDVTARRGLEARVRNAERLEAIGQLAGGVAHDFNNVLLVIRGYSSVLRSTLNDPQQIADVDEIAQAADRAAELTRQLLAFGRRQVMQPRMLSLAEVARGMRSLLTGSLREDIQLRLDLADDISPVIADPSQMERVILNLVVNARDAMHDGGVVELSVSEVALTGAEDGISPPVPEGRYAALAVSDTGTGISDDVLPHIFEPFFTTKDDGIGTGLGLSTVHGVVAQSDGGVGVRTGGTGTTVTVYLPLTAGPIEGDAWAAAAGAHVLRGTETILLVEDEEPVRELVRRVLESSGYNVVAAERPSHAEQLLEEHDEIDLVLTDVVMPEMSGYDLVARIREARPGIRTLFMSGYAHRVPGADNAEGELLKKPFAPEQLARAVRNALDDSSAPETA